MIVVVLILFSAAQAFGNAPGSCIGCHGDAKGMKASGFPQFVVTAEATRIQTGMPASCPDCHRGNPSEPSREAAHRGLLRLLVVGRDGLKATTRDRLPAYRPESLVPKGSGMNAIGTNLLYHDKNPDTLSHDPAIQTSTCGRCHPRETAQFRKTAMGSNAKQSRYRSWTDPERGPHNCGVWFETGFREIAANSTLPFPEETMRVNQKACASCHASCLDCHYRPSVPESADPTKGTHTFSRLVKPESCYGGGRGQICHSGPEERRRGAGYLGGDYANPRGLAPDVHLAKGILCTDCHDTAARDNTLLHGQVKRQATCGRCHPKGVASLASSEHKNVSCEACHIGEVGGYQATFWGPGELAGVKTPFYKYKNYYGTMRAPILVRDRIGRWIPVKPFPMGVSNQRGIGALKTGFAWRWPGNPPPAERTDDSYAVVGLFSGVGSNDNVLAWIQMDKMSHKLGKARSCESCHTPDGSQNREVAWEYDDDGAAPFRGGHTIAANREGLSIRGMRASSEVVADEGWTTGAFAPWLNLKDIWRIGGDYSVPIVQKLSGKRPHD